MARKRLPSLLSFLTGRVVAVKAETDGDLHIALTDATGDKPRIVVVEVPAEPRWCSIRETVFSWRQTKFPFHTSSAKKTKITHPSVITVVGKAFFDIEHSLKDRSKNRRRISRVTPLRRLTPVMKLTVQ